MKRKEKLAANKEKAKSIKDNEARMKEVIDQLDACREEIKNYVVDNTKLTEENRVLKEIIVTKDTLKDRSNPDVINQETPDIIDLETETADISDEEAANVFLKNRNDTGARQKTSLKCNICDFVAKDGKLLKGHMSLHNAVSGNFENGIMRHKDGYTCNKCGETVKTMGLMRRHI